MTITFAPVPDFLSKVTIKAVQSGKASDPATWDLNRPLQDGDFYLVPAGITVTWDLTSCPNLAGRLIQGTLDAGSAPGDKVCHLVTSMVDSGGLFQCGSCQSNTPLEGTYTENFLDVFPDVVFDPGQFGTGFLTMGGKVNMCGAANKSAWVRCKGVAQTSNQITLLDLPQGWQMGDELLLPGTVFATPRQDEVLSLSSLSGNVATLSAPLAFDHSTPVVSFAPQSWTQGTISISVDYQLVQNADWSVTVNSTYTWKDSQSGQGDTYTGSFTWMDSYLVDDTHVSPCLYLGNLTRKIVFRSVNPDGTRGHFMFMKDMNHNPSLTSLCHVAFENLGRTKATEVVTDPMVDTSFNPPQLVAGTANNVRARYAVHSHRQGQGTGYGDTSAQQIWDGLVVRGYMKWGFDNHDSNVLCSNCIAYDGDGAGFATERGTEIGSYSNCLSVASFGVGDNQNHGSINNDKIDMARFPSDDFGFIGNGVWLQGPGVSVKHCIMAGHVSGGLFWYPDGPQSTKSPGVVAKTMPWVNLPPQQQQFFLAQTGYSATNPPPLSAVAPYGIANNVAFACGGAGFTALPGTSPGSLVGNEANFQGCTIWNNLGGVAQGYAANISFVNTVAIGPNVNGAKVGTPSNYQSPRGYVGSSVNPGYSRNLLSSNITLLGWDIGFMGTNLTNKLITDGYYANTVDFWVPLGFGPSGTTLPAQFYWSGQPIFGALQQSLTGQGRFNFYFTPEPSTAPVDPVSPLNLVNFSLDFDVNLLFRSNRYVLPHNWQLFFANSGPDDVPFPSGGSYSKNFPATLIGLTNTQIIQQMGKGLWDFPAAVTATVCPWSSNGIIGNQQDWAGYTPATYPRFLTANTVYPQSAQGYQLQVLDVLTPGAKVVTLPAMDLVSGWNFIKQTLDNIPWVFAVFGPPTSPLPPAGLSLGCNQVVVSWNTTSNAAYYNLQRSTDGVSYTSLATGLTTLNYTDSSVLPGTTYYYQVQAANAYGVSTWSAAVQIAVPQ